MDAFPDFPEEDEPDCALEALPSDWDLAEEEPDCAFELLAPESDCFDDDEPDWDFEPPPPDCFPEEEPDCALAPLAPDCDCFEEEPDWDFDPLFPDRDCFEDEPPLLAPLEDRSFELLAAVFDFEDFEDEFPSDPVAVSSDEESPFCCAEEPPLAPPLVFRSAIESPPLVKYPPRRPLPRERDRTRASYRDTTDCVSCNAFRPSLSPGRRMLDRPSLPLTRRSA